ncbi:MAG: sigma-70 family RNA polymerase sigma factor, partial [Planctomycetota bacterium]
MSGERVDIESLLQHRPFVRRLARSLVRDESRADDLVQETWMAALRNPPRSRGAVRAWLASVVRKLAWTQRRSDERRVARERRGPTPATARLPEEALERAQWHRRVVDAVMELAEPYRTTILLRYFEELSGEEIARLQEIPSATVRTRLRRGLDQLRKRLDEEVEGGRRAWMLALLPFALEDLPPAPPAGVSWKVAAAGVVVAVGAVVGVHLSSRSRPPRERSLPVAQRPASPSAPSLPLSIDEEKARLAAPHAIEVVVLAGGRPAEGALVALARTAEHPWRWTPRTSWEPRKQRRTDADGKAAFMGLSNGYLRIVGLLPGWGRAHTFVHLPFEVDQPVVLELPEQRVRKVTVVEQGNGRPVAGARVEVWEDWAGPWVPAPATAPTDARGESYLQGISPDESFRLRVTCVGYAPCGLRPVMAETRDVPIELGPRRASRSWPLSAPPPEGTPILLRRINEPTPGIATARIEGEVLRVDGLADGEMTDLLALTPEGSFARLGEETVTVEFHAPPVLRVTVRDPAARPRAGIPIRLFDPETQHPVFPDGVTDEEGVAALPVYAQEPVQVRLRERRFGPSRVVGLYAPASGPADMRATVAAARPVEIRVRLDGEPGLPNEYRVYAEKVRLAPQEFDADEARGLLRMGTHRPDEPIHLLARGYLPATAVGDEVRLVRSAALELKVSLRDVRQRYHLELVDAVDESRPLWRGPWRLLLYPGPDNVVRESMIQPGRYRVRDTVSGRATEVLVIPPGPAVVRAYLDLTRVGAPEPDWVRGSVVAYRDIDLRKVDLTAIAESGEARQLEIARDGSFAFPWFGKGLVQLRATHPQLAGAMISLARPRKEPVVLRLSPTHVALLQLEEAPERLRADQTSPRVLLFPEEGKPLALEVTMTGDVLRFAGFRTGAYRIWLDLPGYAPHTIEHVVLRAGTNDLGALSLRRGSSLRIRVLGGEEGDLPRLT